MPARDERLDQMRVMRATGMTYRDIARDLGVHPSYVGKVLGPVPRRKSRGKERRLNAAPETWRGMVEVAEALGLVNVQGRKAGAGSIVMLMDAIANREVEITWQAGCGPDHPPRSQR